MAVFRVDKSKDYTVMSNFHLRDNQLSLKAKGLLSLMLSLPDEWDYTLAGLAKINREGVAAIRAAVVELEKAGYIRRERTRTESGVFEGTEYIIRESPICENRTLDSPKCDLPILEKPTLENRTEINIDLKNTDSTPYNPPQEGVSSQKSKDDVFEFFWKFYPRKTDKQRARRAFAKLNVDRPLLARMVIALKKQAASPQWQKQGGQYIPHASTWLNGRRWEDEVAGGPEPPEGGGSYGKVVETEGVPVW